MEEITWDDVRKSDWLIVRQRRSEGPLLSYVLEWGGKVAEHNNKWTQLTYRGMTRSLPTQYGDEQVLKLTEKEFKAYIKENYSEGFGRV